jgi:hypothetical protein
VFTLNVNYEEEVDWIEFLRLFVNERIDHFLVEYLVITALDCYSHKAESSLTLAQISSYEIIYHRDRLL